MNIEHRCELMSSRNIVKVFHGAFNDIKLLYSACERFPKLKFDTLIEANFLGVANSTSYSKLVKLVLNVEICKEERRSN